MRVISGSARGRKLREPAGNDIRPTSDMVKESIFDIIQFDIEGRRVLDLFAGTGQLGIEALSRGAGHVTFVDSKQEAVKLIWENLKICGFTGLASVHTCDALKYLGRNDPVIGDQDAINDHVFDAWPRPGRRRVEKYDLIFLDPPYNTPLLGRALVKIMEFDKLNTNGIIMCEAKADSVAPDAAPPYCFQKQYKYGSVKIMRYERGQ